MGSKKVSVIITCYNCGKYIEKVIKSLLKQTYKNTEIVIINDYSTDKRRDIIKKYTDKHKNILFFDEKERAGTLISRMKGIKNCTGDYILILDTGETIKPKYIKKAVKIFEEKPETGIVIHKNRFFKRTKIIPDNFDNTIEILLYTGHLYSGCMFRKEDFLKKGKRTVFINENEFSIKNSIKKYINKKERYDLIFSIGEVCFCSTVLRKCNLQNTSYPFDWNGAIEFYKKCKILANRFYNFFEKKDLQFMQKYINEESFAYRNTYNEMIFNHDFPKEISFDEAYEIAKKKYDKRATRLLKNIKKARSVLAVYMEAPTNDHVDIPDSEIIEGHKLLQKVFGKKFHTLYIKNSLTENTKTELAEGLTKIVSDYKDMNDKTGLYPNQKKLKHIMKNYRANLPISYLIKRKTIKILLNFVPDKNKRAQIRKKYHIF